MSRREELVALAGQALIMRYLAEHEGLAFTKVQLCAILDIHPSTVAKYITRLRDNPQYERFFRTMYCDVVQHGVPRKWIAHYYVVSPARATLFGI